MCVGVSAGLVPEEGRLVLAGFVHHPWLRALEVGRVGIGAGTREVDVLLTLEPRGSGVETRLPLFDRALEETGVVASPVVGVVIDLLLGFLHALLVVGDGDVALAV